MKPKNARATNKRRTKKVNVLEVTLTQSKERTRRRRRICRNVCLLILTIGLIVGSYVGGKEALRRFVWENPDYVLREVTFNTNGTLLREDVMKYAGLTTGQNIFRVNIATARQRISDIPQVERSTVKRQFPNRVIVDIVEREPIAWVVKDTKVDPNVSDSAFLIDARGIAMKPRPKQRRYKLPIIVGFAVEDLADGQRANNYELTAALELIRLNERNMQWTISTIDVQSGYSLLVTDVRGLELLFGLDNIEQQRANLRLILEQMSPEMQKETKRINLFSTRTVYVTPRPPPEPEPETPEITRVSNEMRPSGKPAPVSRSTLAVKTPTRSQAAKATPTPKPSPSARKSEPAPTSMKPAPRPIAVPPIRKPSTSSTSGNLKPFNY